jgi:hypothetical protein
MGRNTLMWKFLNWLIDQIKAYYNKSFTDKKSEITPEEMQQLPEDLLVDQICLYIMKDFLEKKIDYTSKDFTWTMSNIKVRIIPRAYGDFCYITERAKRTSDLCVHFSDNLLAISNVNKIKILKTWGEIGEAYYNLKDLKRKEANNKQILDALEEIVEGKGDKQC